MLKPVDLYALAHLVTSSGQQTQVSIANALGIAQSNVHRSLGQLQVCGLLSPDRKPVIRPFRQLLVHAVRHVYPPDLGPPVRGIPTAHSAPMLGNLISVTANLVWPYDGGSAVGTSVKPLHRAAPTAAIANTGLYELLALIDVFRCGRVRERVEAEVRLDTLLTGRS